MRVSQNPDSRRRSHSGLTLLELTIAMAVLSVMTIAITLSLDRQARSMSATTSRKSVELNAEMVLEEMVDRLRYARWADTRTQMQGGVSAAQTDMVVEEIVGFPPTGTLILDPGTDTAERVIYGSQSFAARRFDAVQRGMQCSDADAFADGTVVQWEGLAAWTTDQVAPGVDEFDGVSSELGRGIFYVGDGTGVVFQVPIRAAGGDFFDAGGEMTWGASVDGADSLGGFHCFQFEAVDAVLEGNLASDLNQDGDQDDIFDLGHIVLVTWDASDPDQVQSATISPPILLQERCSYGGDLDGDGFNDPIFLLDPGSGRLRIRTFSLVRGLEAARTHRDEISTLLVNSLEN